jgi:ribose 5-phosphate isomerase B
MNKLYVGADHAGYKLKQKIKKTYKLIDIGNKKYEPNDDYPDFAARLAKKVVKNKTKGILFCGSAEGMCIAANKIKGIRAVAVWTIRDAKKSRQHNDANILCLSGKNLSFMKTKKIIKAWLKTPFSQAERHKRRILKIHK